MSEFICALCGDDLKYSDEHKTHVHATTGKLTAEDLNGKKHVMLPKRKGCYDGPKESK